jgi:ribonuclease Z
VPCDSLDALCRGADVYAQTVVRDDLIRPVPMARFVDVLDYHSTVADAARCLVLTHQVPTVQPGAEEEWRALAAAHFDGEVVVGDDGVTVGLPV